MISIKNLKFYYKKNENLLFNSLDLELEEGKIYGLLGKNGAGKTTLFKLISGLLFPVEGTIIVDKIEPVKRDQNIFNMIFFYPEKINLPDMKIYDFVKLFLPVYKNSDQEIFNKLAKEMDLPINRKISQLSYGTSKKFYLAFALATNNRYLLLDEPTTGLDIPSKKDFRKFIAKNLNKEKTIIISSHQVKDFNMLLDEVIIIHNGKIMFKNSIEEIENRLTVSPVFGDLTDFKNDLIYFEEITGGYICLLDNRNEKYQKKPIDLELFFNAVIYEKSNINSVFDIE